MKRYATIDIGTNSVLLLVAERDPSGKFVPVAERAEITRLGRGVDQFHRLSDQAMEETLQVVRQFSSEARQLGAAEIAVTATSAARDAQNGDQFVRAAEQQAGVQVEILSGDREAHLTFLAVAHEFGRAGPPLLVIDIGGGSTEFVYGGTDPNPARVSFHRSFDVGSVRLTERFVRSDPISDQDQRAIRDYLRWQLDLPPPPPSFRLVGVAGTVTTLYAIHHQIDSYDPARVHGGILTLAELRSLSQRLCAIPLEQRRNLPGLQPKRAEVICAGSLILETALEKLGASECTISDRGLRWGLLLSRFGAGA
jgi:exopolyphosphatase/guanosine-5'-triphosphate,3'-diphosphate pyrophosphatase